MKDIRIMSLDADGTVSMALSPVVSFVSGDTEIHQRYIKEMKSSSFWNSMEYAETADSISVSIALSDANAKMKKIYPDRSIVGKLKKLDKSSKSSQCKVSIELVIDNISVNMEV